MHTTFKNIAIASDHGGFHLKNEILNEFNEFKDYGTFSEDSVDYPDYARKVCDAIVSGELCAGILICKTGIGMSMAANKFSNIRAALCYCKEFAKLSREHNNANVLCLSSEIDYDDIIDTIKIFLDTPFSNEKRHLRRVRKLCLEKL